MPRSPSAPLDGEWRPARGKRGVAERGQLVYARGGYVEALPNWHHSYLAGEVLTALSAAGVTDEQIDRMTVANPRSIFERCDPY
jgi:hypothetical protein